MHFSLLIFFLFSCASTPPQESAAPHEKRKAQTLLINHFDQQVATTTLTPQEQKDDIHQLIYSLLRIHAGRYFLANINYREKMREIFAMAQSAKGPIEVTNFAEKLKTYLDSFHDPQLQIGDLATFSTHFPPIKTIDYASIAQEDPKNKVLYLKLDSFTFQDPQGFLTQLQSRVHKSKKIIFDLREHWDINDEQGLKIARALHGNTLQHGVIRQHSVYTQESVVSLINALKLQAQIYPEYAIQKQSEIDSLAPLISSIKQQRPPIVGVEIPRDEMPYNSRDAFEGEIFFLINKNCTQTCESFVLAFTNFPEKKIVGEQSQGGILFSRPGLIQLKNSKLMVQIPTAYNEFINREMAGKNALTPDQATINFPLNIHL
jgi:hypothetical protein